VGNSKPCLQTSVAGVPAYTVRIDPALEERNDPAATCRRRMAHSHGREWWPGVYRLGTCS
jgi:hypothetical protein